MRSHRRFALFVLLLSLLFLPHFLSAQISKVYSDSLLVFRWLEKADDLDLSGDLDSAAIYASKALSKSKEKKLIKGEGFSVLKLADLLLKTEGSDSVLLLCQEGIRLGERAQDSFMIGLGHHQLGQYYRDKTLNIQALASFLQASSYYSTAKDLNYLALTYNDIGFIYERQGSYEQATHFNFKAIALFEKLNNLKELANTKGNLGIVYYKMNKKDLAIQLFKESAGLREQIKDSKGLAAIYGNLATAYGAISLDSAIHYQKLALNQAIKNGVKSNMAQANTNTAMLLSRQKKYKEALDYELESIRLYAEIGDRNKVATRYISTALAYQALGDSLHTETYFQKAGQLADELNNKPLFQNLYLQQSLLYRNRNNFKSALEKTELYQKYKDSLFNEKTLTNIAEIQTKYDTEKKDLAIARLTADQKIKELEILNQRTLIHASRLEADKRTDQIKLLQQDQIIKDGKLALQQEEMDRKTEQSRLQQELLQKENLLSANDLSRQKLFKNIIIAAVVFLLLFIGIIFNRYQLQQKIKEQARLLSIRNTISKDLHDEIGSTLTSISVLSKVSVDVVDRQPVQAKEMLSKITSQSKAVQQSLSDIVWSMRPDTHKGEYLISRIREYAAHTLEPEQIELTINAEEFILQKSLNETQRKEILLIVKEALNNIVKHARADQVYINCSHREKRLTFDIIDNGSWKSINETTGTGLTSMKERSHRIGGELNIRKSDNGTTINLSIPVAV